MHGHELVGTTAATVEEGDALVVREWDGLRWYRCLRCDTWSPLPPPVAPTRERVPAAEEIELPLRGRPLRDRFVLRLIAAEKSLHVLVVGLLAAGIFLFAAHRRELRGDYTRVLNDFQVGFGNPGGQHHGILSDLNHLFALSRVDLYLIGVALIAYGTVVAFEVVGLWYAQRWAEYLAFVETVVFVPYELYDLSSHVSALTIVALVVNAAIVAYLVVVHRLFGLRGGPDQVAVDAGWPSVKRATPPLAVTTAERGE